jgi:hypothetical protein
VWTAVGGGGGQRAENQDGVSGADGWGGEGTEGGRGGGREGGRAMFVSGTDGWGQCFLLFVALSLPPSLPSFTSSVGLQGGVRDDGLEGGGLYLPKRALFNTST